MNSSVTIKKKAAGKNFRVVLTLYYVVEGGGDLGDEILRSSLSYYRNNYYSAQGGFNFSSALSLGAPCFQQHIIMGFFFNFEFL